MPNICYLNTLYPTIIDFAAKVAFALVIIVIGRWVARICAKLSEKALNRSQLDATLVNFLKNITYFTIIIFTFIAALNKLGVETTSFVALIGAAGLTIGMALQGSLANFAAGVMIVIFHPFKVGDKIEVDGATGIVKEIQIFNTILSGDNNISIIIPNGKITSDKIFVTNR
jgi:small conductance mechanosensitive channel